MTQGKPPSRGLALVKLDFLIGTKLGSDAGTKQKPPSQSPNLQQNGAKLTRKVQKILPANPPPKNLFSGRTNGFSRFSKRGVCAPRPRANISQSVLNPALADETNRDTSGKTSLVLLDFGKSCQVAVSMIFPITG